MKRSEIINSLISKFGYQSYLEIGVRHPTHNFDFIVAEHKVGVDPAESACATYCMTSDEFFKQNEERFDIVFVDGLHHADQCFIDINQSLKVLKPGGSIVVHDCKPESYEAQVVPRMQNVWNGDVWKAWVLLRYKREDLEMFVVDSDEGCGIIRKGHQKLIKLDGPLEYDYFVTKMQEWLNLVSVEEFQEWLKTGVLHDRI